MTVVSVPLYKSKTNLEKEGETMAFRLSDSGFQWLGEVDISADELLSGCSNSDKHKTAVEFLQKCFK